MHEINHIFENNFKTNKYVESELIYGNIFLVPSPLITIAIPTYRRHSLLKFAIESSINQLNKKISYELIIVDNENSEDTNQIQSIIKSFNDPKILYYRNKRNLGMVGNWNRCIELARGKWIAFLHDDDLLDEEYLDRIACLIESKKNIGGILSSLKTIKNDSNNINSKESEINFLKKIFKKASSNKLMRLRPIDSQISGNVYGPPTCGAIFRKKYLLELGGFDEKFYPSSDWFFLYGFSKKYKLYMSFTNFGYYRILDNESLNSKTLNSFILQGIEFRNYLFSTTKFGKVLDLVFKNERYYQTLNWVKKLDNKSEINFEVLSETLGYYHRPYRQFVFRKLQQIYVYSKRLFSVIFG